MAINLTCYSTSSVSDLQEKIDMLAKKYSHIFPEHYILYNAEEPDEIEKEISNEFGLDPRSWFLIAYNKSEKIFTSEIADMLREELGKESIIVLYEGETLI